MAATTATELTGPLLKQVSRSFYLTLRILPAPVRPQISLAYLLARASDTIADTEAVPRAKRVICLREFQPLTRVPNLGAIAENQALPGERELLARLGECLDMLNTFRTADCRLIQQLLETITTGQIFDLERFPAGNLTSLTDDAELDRYTYLVAGCVGEFWTKMCQAHVKGMGQWGDGAMVEKGIRFGKGLQLVNILRDVAEDRRRGRQYLPDLAGYQTWLDRAVEHLDAGWQYTLSIPARQWRVRLACTWPIWIGLETIALLRRAAPDQRVKVPQGVVNRLLLRSFLGCRSNAALDQRYRQLVERASRPFPP
jgi:farnesyl-diphosphate farnesyltransferase